MCEFGNWDTVVEPKLVWLEVIPDKAFTFYTSVKVGSVNVIFLSDTKIKYPLFNLDEYGYFPVYIVEEQLKNKFMKKNIKRIIFFILL